MNKKTILVVDPEESFQEAINDILTEEGYKVIKSASGEEVLKLVDFESIDLVLTEIWLPELDGFSFFKEIKKRKMDLPVIIISGHSNLDLAFQAGKMGVTYFLEKPLSLDALLIVIKRTFDKK